MRGSNARARAPTSGMRIEAASAAVISTIRPPACNPLLRLSRSTLSEDFHDPRALLRAKFSTTSSDEQDLEFFAFGRLQKGALPPFQDQRMSREPNRFSPTQKSPDCS